MKVKKRTPRNKSFKYFSESGQYLLMNLNYFEQWLDELEISRPIKRIQNHHTYIPNYEHFTDDNHFKLCEGMKRSHLKRKFSDIAQNLTTFPDGKIALCRPMNTIPAGIKGANSGGICIEHIGDFDNEEMNKNHKYVIYAMNAMLLKKFGLPVDTDSIVYHHWWTASGKRTNGLNPSKSCPGVKFFGGNKVEDCEANFLPLIKSEMELL